MSLLTPIPLDAEKVRALIPTFRQRQGKLDDLWRNALRQDAWLSATEAVTAMDLQHRAELGNAVELAPFLRIGRLTMESAPGKGRHKEPAKYLAENDYPALLLFRNKAAVLGFSAVDADRMARLTQSCVIQLMCNLDPSVVRCTAIDLQSFGAAFSLLTASLPKLELLTGANGVDDFFRGLPEQLKERNQVKGFAFPYLFEYNRAHKDSAFPYHFVFVGSFENDLTEPQKTLLAKLLNHANAAKAGIYFLLLFSTPEGFDQMLRAYPSLPGMVEVTNSNGGRKIELHDPEGLDTRKQGVEGVLEVLPDAEDLEALHRMTKHCWEHMNQRKPEAVKLALPTAQTWQATAWKESTAEGLGVPIGKSKGKLFQFRLGSPEIVHNALVGGAVGTGKTNLLHAIIVQALASYSPVELHLSMLDYKNGTEFNVYDGIPHLYALSLGTGTKFGLDLLTHFQSELERRAGLFKQAGVTNLPAYREKTGEALARHLVVIDEFQVLLGSRRHGLSASAALDDLIRRGRSFGFNFVLSSQSLKDGTLSSSAKSNIGCRVCLRLSESDCADFLSVENPLPSTFQYSGQAVYNNQEGRRDGNEELKIAHYPEQELKEFIALLRQKAVTSRPVASPAPYTYYGAGDLLKSSLALQRPERGIFLGLEEGIPSVQRFLSLHPGTGPILATGTGRARALFEASLKDELESARQIRYQEVSGAELEGFCGQLQDNPDSLADLDLVVFRPRPKESNSPTIQNACTQISSDGRCKLIVLADTPGVIRGLIFDRNNAEVVVCFDQRSYADFGGGSELAGQDQIAALFFPGEPDPVFVKIPQLETNP